MWNFNNGQILRKMIKDNSTEVTDVIYVEMVNLLLETPFPQLKQFLLVREPIVILLLLAGTKRLQFSLMIPIISNRNL